MFRPVADILKPDPRHESEFLYYPATRQSRAATVADWHAPIAKIELAPNVPQRIREEFDKARNAFLYSWFSYELATLAEQQSYATLEMAIRIRLNEH
ncbi:MAG: hypothetical protein ACREDJ_11010, partial [Methylocella sp.]